MDTPANHNPPQGSPDWAAIALQAGRLFGRPGQGTETLRAVLAGRFEETPGAIACREFLEKHPGYQEGIPAAIREQATTVMDLLASGLYNEAARLRADMAVESMGFRRGSPEGDVVRKSLRDLDESVEMHLERVPVPGTFVYEEDVDEWIFREAAADPEYWWVTLDGGKRIQ